MGECFGSPTVWLVQRNTIREDRCYNAQDPTSEHLAGDERKGTYQIGPLGEQLCSLLTTQKSAWATGDHDLRPEGTVSRWGSQGQCPWVPKECRGDPVRC